VNRTNIDEDVSKDFMFVVRGQPWNKKVAKIIYRFPAGDEPIATAMELVANLEV